MPADAPARASLRFAFTLVFLLSGWFAATSASAQPFGRLLVLHGESGHGYLRVPHGADLNPSSAITIETWLRTPATLPDCQSIVGKSFTTGYWLGRCDGQLRSYFTANGFAATGGVIPDGQWTHVAAVFDGIRHRHYINGERVLDEPAAGSLAASGAELRIGSDVDFEVTINGSLDELRIWNVARTEAQLRSLINVRAEPQPGLVALYRFEGNADDSTGGHDGTVMGTGVSFGLRPPAPACIPGNPQEVCLLERFLVKARYRTGAPGTPEQTASIAACPNPGSVLFYYVNPNNWEIMLKMLNACTLNERFWVFTAATTTIFYRLEVEDVLQAEPKIYFNYPGGIAEGVADTTAFATCP